MNQMLERSKTRRRFLKMLGASPLIAGSSMLGSGLATLLNAAPLEEKHFLGWLESFQQSDDVVSSPDQALDVMDFEPAARKAIPPAHFGYLATGVDDDATVRANREGYSHIQIRSRRLVDVSNIYMSRTIFGTKWSTPIVLSPVSAQKAFHPDGELGVARAAKTKGHLMMLSTVATASIEDAIAARGGPVWQQLYPTNVWEVCRAIVKRRRPRVGQLRQHAQQHATVERESAAIPASTGANHQRRRENRLRIPIRVTFTFTCTFANPMFNGLDVSKVTQLYPLAVDWDFVKRLRDTVTVKFLIKGIVTREDAQLAVEHGVDGLIVSNHGGRAEDTLRPTIESLPEVLDAVAGKVPVIVDGGVRRGTDIFKALALGATAVGIGRPHSWGLGAFGQAGVEAVLEILQRELRTIMRQAGTTSVDKITRDYLSLHLS